MPPKRIKKEKTSGGQQNKKKKSAAQHESDSPSSPDSASTMCAKNKKLIDALAARIEELREEFEEKFPNGIPPRVVEVKKDAA
jgi:hypothetical protein